HDRTATAHPAAEAAGRRDTPGRDQLVRAAPGRREQVSQDDTRCHDPAKAPITTQSDHTGTQRTSRRAERLIFASQSSTGRDAISAQITPIWTVCLAIGPERTSAPGSGAADTSAGRTFRRQRLS